MSRCQSLGCFPETEEKESLLDRHGAPHEGKMTREGADVLVGTRFFRCGELNGFRLGGTKQLGGCDYVTHQGLRESVGGVGAGTQGFLSESYGGDSLFEHNQVVAHCDFRDLPNVLECEFDLGPGFRFEVFDVELHGVVTGDGNLLHRVIGLDVAKDKRCREGEERKYFHEHQGMKVCVKSKSVRTDFGI